MPRIRTLDDPVAMTLDGEPVVAQRGEPAAAALIAGGYLALARSPKFHRPRGPACMRGGCDGCLARVDGEPNVMTCRIPAADGMRIETQNVLGSRDADLLRVTDWLFPHGMNHHELFAGVPGVQRVMQTMARRIAGLGKLPSEAGVPKPAGRRDADVLVVGAGPAGMAAALELSHRGRRVELVDDDLTWGGAVRTLPERHLAPWLPLLGAFDEARRAGRIVLRLRTTAAGVYGADVLLAGPDGASVVTARTLVLAPGAHDGVVAFEGNDLPGVMSARAACRLLTHGVLPAKIMLVVATPDDVAPFAEAYAETVSGATFVRGAIVRAASRSRVRRGPRIVVTVATGDGQRDFPCDALVLGAPGAPAYELCAQAGAELIHEMRGFAVKTKAGAGAGAGAGGAIGAGIVAIGEVAGTPLDPSALMREVKVIADSL